jgi:hypothetical protein
MNLKLTLTPLLPLVFGLGLPAMPLFINGSLTGPVVNGIDTPNSVPSGWSVLNLTPDTVDINSNIGRPGVPFLAVPTGPSPDGGTWVGIGIAGATTERFGQTVSGFEVGKIYAISWYLGNFGFNRSTTDGNIPFADPSGIRLLVDGASAGSSAAKTLGSDWLFQTLSFTAANTSHQIAFEGTSVETLAYISIDGLSIAEIPEPASMMVCALGLLAVAGIRRLR